MDTKEHESKNQVQPLSKDQWIEAAYKELCRRLGPPETEAIEKNMREWAQLMATDDPPHNESFYTEGYTPEDAVHDEIQAGL
jgi:hypothetical protein